jgi:membrane protein YqaA with SNARE-associated domain
MDRKALGAIQLFAAALMAAAVLYFSKDIAALGAYGYAGAFLIAVLSSATILFPAPGWAAVIALSSVLDPLLLGIVVGIGSAIGELTGYVAGEGVREIMNSHIRESRKIEELVKKYDVAAIFVLSFIPNPLFDIAGVVAGGLRIPWWHFLIACAAGRVIRYVLLALAGSLTLGFLS